MIPETLRLGVVNNTGMRLDKRAWMSEMRFPRQTVMDDEIEFKWHSKFVYNSQ